MINPCVRLKNNGPSGLASFYNIIRSQQHCFMGRQCLFTAVHGDIALHLRQDRYLVRLDLRFQEIRKRNSHSEYEAAEDAQGSRAFHRGL
jgi:hypothetical protein